MRMKRLIYITAIVLAAVSCSKDPVAVSYVEDDDIRFNAVSYVNATKTDPAQSSLGTDVRFGVSSTLNANGGKYIYIENQEVAYNSESTTWAGVKSLKWPKGPADYTLDFQAYAPYSENPWCRIDDESGKLVSSGTDGIEVFTIDSTDTNYDLLYSDWTRGMNKDNNSSGGVPMLFHHALAAVNVGLNIVRSNDAVILDANGRYTYEEWVPGDDKYNETHTSYIVPIGQHPNDTLGIVLTEGTTLSGDVVVFDPNDHNKTITLSAGSKLDQDYRQYQKFGYRLKNSIQNIWIASLVECRLENIATTGTLEMDSTNGTWQLPPNSVWTVPSEGVAGATAHGGSFTFFEEKDIEIPPHMRSTVHIFPMELHIIPQDLHWSPLTPGNNQKLHIKMHVRQFNYKDQSVNDKNDKNSKDADTGDGDCFDYRDIYQYETNDNGSFKGYLTQEAELAPGVKYTSMVWREKVWRETSEGVWAEVDFKPTYEYDVEKDILLYDSDNFVTSAPQYWKMNTRTIYITRINFADHLIEFDPSVQPFAETQVVGGGINNW